MAMTVCGLRGKSPVTVSIPIPTILGLLHDGQTFPTTGHMEHRYGL